MDAEGTLWIVLLIGVAVMLWRWLGTSRTEWEQREQAALDAPPEQPAEADADADADAPVEVSAEDGSASREIVEEQVAAKAESALVDDEWRAAKQAGLAELDRMAAEAEAAVLRQAQDAAAAQAAAAEVTARAELAAEAEVARIAAEAQEAARIAAEAQEAARIAEQAQAARVAAEAEALRPAAQAAAAALAAQAEAERIAAEAQAHARAEAQAQASLAAAVEASRRAAPVPPPVRPRPATPAETLVMVADDSKVVRVKTSRLLLAHGYRVVLAEDGDDAARKIEQEPPHVLITDVEMPGLDGFELTRRVRGHPLLADIPVIMITSADDRHGAEGRLAGVSVMLGKPYSEEQLIAHVAGAHADAAQASLAN